MNLVTYPEVEIFSDGACSGNPGPGGWGVLLRYGGREKLLSGGEHETTNNRMELMGAIKGLEALKRPCRVKLVTDSKYLQSGITQWMVRWKQHAWKTSNRKPVKNVDLWQRLDLCAAAHEVTWVWVRGHSGHPDNERVDALAKEAILRLKGSR